MYRKFKPLNIPDGWEQYWSKYPNGYTIMEALIDWVSQVDDMVNNQNELSDTVQSFGESIDEFINQFGAELQNEVQELLTEWQNSGFLNVVISEALQWELDDFKATTEQNFLSVNQQLQQTRKYANVKKFGAIGDGVADDTQALIDAIHYANLNEETVYIPNGVYLITETIDLTTLSFAVNETAPDYSYRLIIEGENVGKTVLLCEVGVKKLFSYNPSNKSNRRSFTFENLKIRSKEPYNELTQRADLIAFELLSCPFTYFKNIDFMGVREGIHMQSCWFSKFENIVGSRISRGLFLDGTSPDGTNYGFADHCYLNDIRFGTGINEWGLKMLGCRSGKVINFNSEAGYSGHGVIMEGCHSVEFDTFYIENYINAQVFKITGLSAIKSVDDFSSDITLKNGFVYNLQTAFINFGKGVENFKLEKTRFTFDYTSANPIKNQQMSMFSIGGGEQERGLYYRNLDVLDNNYYSDENTLLAFNESYSLLFKNNGRTFVNTTNIAYYQPTFTKGTILIPTNEALAYRSIFVKSSGSYGTLNNVTGTISSGSNVATFNDVAGIVPGTYLNVGEFTRAKVLSKDPTTNKVVFGKNATTTVTGGVVSYCNPELIYDNEI